MFSIILETKGNGFYFILILTVFALFGSLMFVLQPGKLVQDMMAVFLLLDLLLGICFFIANSLFVGNII
eukprot:snap_masked-scaffold_19-processed-gene-3.26-mRNA-1 protein AED:1.00 eAED:1.00 QI:0/0/0/0/1/1/2/0/68